MIMLDNYRNRFGTTRMVLISGLVYFISQACIAAILHDLNPLLFVKAQTTFSKDVYLELLNAWQAAGLMPKYFRHFYLDFFHPIFYAVFLSAFMAKTMNMNHFSSKLNRLLLMPFIAGAMDLVENCFHLSFISDVNSITQTKITVSALASNIKWALAGIALLIILFFFIRYRFKPRKGR
jgi:hypothetical protein